MSGVDKAGNPSPGGAKSDCAWLSVEVPLEVVGNGCGTAALGEVPEWVQNVAGQHPHVRDDHCSGESGVRPARCCLCSGRPSSTSSRAREWTSAPCRASEADDKFLADIREICKTELRGAANRADLTKCKNGIPLKYLQPLALSGLTVFTGLNTVGAMTYKEIVRTFGGVGYDWDVTTPDTQHSMPATSTEPRGGGRKGA